MLEKGVIVARTGDDLLRYHGKMMIVDDELYVLGFNYTKLDIDKSRSFGIVTKDPKLIKEATALFDADSTRQPYVPNYDRLVVSPESSRKILKEFIDGAKKQLLIYDAKVTDRMMVKALQARAKDGVEIRMFGKIGKGAPDVDARKMPGLRLHVRAMVRDGSTAFVGSQSLRKLEMDGRREVGVIVSDTAIAKRMQEVFEADWLKTLSKSEVKEVKAAAENGKSDKDKDKARKRRKRRRPGNREGLAAAYSRLGRAITPESITFPVRDTALKYISSPSISTARNACSVALAASREAGVLVEVSLAQLAARADHEVDDAVLRLDALVDVVVSGEDHADAVLEEHRLQHLPLGQIRAVPPARRVERVVEIGDLPVVARIVELTFQPLQLLRVEIRRLEREEPDALLRRLERVVGAAAHVERLVVALLARIVVAERGVELHAAVEQRLVGLLELVEEVFRAVPAIEVVADGQHQRERELRPHARHLLAELVLLALAGAEVSHDAELERVGLVRQRQRQRRRRCCRRLRRCLSGGRANRLPRHPRAARRSSRQTVRASPWR